MKQAHRVFALALALLMLFCALTGCAARATYDTAASEVIAAPNTTAAEAPQESEIDGEIFDLAAEDAAVSAEAGYGSVQLDANSQSSADLSAEKIIYSADVDLQTTRFNRSVQTLEQTVADIGGFVESSNVSGDVEYHSDGTTNVVNRCAYYTVRIPAAHFQDFLLQTNNLGNVLSTNRTAENVTASYTDFEARLSSLNTQETRLLELLAQAEDVDALVALEERLSDVRYEIESIERTLRNLDRQIDYSTVTITLEEVEVYTPTVPVTRTFGEKMADAFSDGWRSFGRSVQRFCIGMAEALPALILLLVLLLAVLLIIHRLRRQHAKKRTAQPPQDDTPSAT